MSRAAIIRVDSPVTPWRTFYVRSVGRDGRFALTCRKAQARRFRLDTAATTMQRLANTAMQFSVCDAPEAANARA